MSPLEPDVDAHPSRVCGEAGSGVRGAVGSVERTAGLAAAFPIRPDLDDVAKAPSVGAEVDDAEPSLADVGAVARAYGRLARLPDSYCTQGNV